jgi:hypothetical protein
MRVRDDCARGICNEAGDCSSRDALPGKITRVSKSDKDEPTAQRDETTHYVQQLHSALHRFEPDVTLQFSNECGNRGRNLLSLRACRDALYSTDWPPWTLLNGFRYMH